MQIADIQTLSQKIKQNISKVIVGRDDTIDLVLTALICNGHILLEDVPGTGKTMLSKSLAASFDCAFKRIQFTPDLLPSDISGINVYNQKEGVFEFKEGPVFTNILLADEINRATPRTQSALLECMEEHQVTADGLTRQLGRFFFVIATQNPIETQGTFPLPEAQLDRFLFKLDMGYPSTDEALQIMDRFISDSPLETLLPVANQANLLEVREVFSQVHVSEPVRRYISALSEATRTAPDVALGVSPRGMLSMMRASQAYAAIHGRDYVLPDDIKRLVAPVFSHRMILRGSAMMHAEKVGRLLDEIIKKTPVPTESDQEPGSRQ